MNTTRIPYGALSWPIITGCSGIDERGKALKCQQRCWARGIYKRFERDFTPCFHPERLSEPLRRKKPARILPAFTGDLFDRFITNEQIAAVFGVMAACPRHTFMVLTKQAERMERWFAWYEKDRNPKRFRHPELVEHAACIVKQACGEKASDVVFRAANECAGRNEWPLRNVMLGVSVMDQEDADTRIPRLLRCPAAIRWLSVEPLLGDIDLGAWARESFHVSHDEYDAPDGASVDGLERIGQTWHRVVGLDWIVTAAESGPKARPCRISWIRSLRDQCAEARIPFAYKDQTSFPVLDGRKHEEFPKARLA